MIPALNSLTCFTHINLIEPIAAGLSSVCFQVHADNKTFFAKRASTNESAVCLHAAKLNISPKVVYHDQHWLVTEFIESDNFSLCQQSIEEKIAIAITLMTQCHQLPVKPMVLEPKSIVDGLIAGLVDDLIGELFEEITVTKIKPTIDKTELLTIANQILSLIPHPTNPVCCHGDLNFSNLLLSAKNQVYLVDYECACTAQAEYDLAMFIAVNNISRQHISTIAEQYKKYTKVKIDLTLLSHYLQFCYFINGLWYAVAFQKSQHSTFTFLAKQQWQNLYSHKLYSSLL